MVRKTLYFAIPYLLGLVCNSLTYYDNLLMLFLVITIVGIGVLIKVFKLGFKRSILCGTGFIVGFLVYSNYMVTTADYIKKFNHQDIFFSGKVIEINEYSGDMSSYVVDGTINGKTKSKIYLYTNNINCSYGDTLLFECNPTEIVNDYLFNSKDYYNSKGIYLQTYSTKNLKVIPSNDIKSKFIRRLNSYRDDTISIFRKNMSKDGSSLLSAILFGDKSDLSKSDKNNITRSGISHMVAVSGLHLAILTSMLDFFLKLIDKKFEIPKLINFIIYESFSFLFVALVGFPISAVRTLIMLSISKMAILFARQSDVLNTLSLTAMIMVTFEPYLIGNASFLLSISGVFGIGVFSNYILDGINMNRFIKGVLTTAFTTLCIFPVSVMFFDEISIISPISNIVCFPLCEIALISGFLTFLLGGKILILNKILLKVADLSCNLIIYFCKTFSKVPMSNVSNGYDILQYVSIAILIISIIGYGMFKDRKLLLKIISFGITSTIMITYLFNSYENDKIKVAILGKSTYKAMVISYNNDVNIIDFSKNYKTTEYIQKYCKQFGFYKVNSLTFTKRAYQTMNVYDSLLQDVSIKRINVPKGTYFRDGQKVLTVSPTYIDVKNYKYIYDYGTFTITVYDNYSFDLTINGKTQTFITEEYNIIFESNLNGFFNVRDLKL
ncbi:MAG: ComEC/Rec2 family competence protein [Oscillospiraceae bacterium]